jgi:hypothetical protein
LFWRYVIKCWCHFNFDSQEQIDEPGNQILWNNSHVKRGGKIIQYKEWERKGLLQLTHLQKRDGKIEVWPNLADKFNLNQSSANIMTSGYRDDKRSGKYNLREGPQSYISNPDMQ